MYRHKMHPFLAENKYTAETLLKPSLSRPLHCTVYSLVLAEVLALVLAIGLAVAVATELALALAVSIALLNG